MALAILDTVKEKIGLTSSSSSTSGLSDSGGLKSFVSYRHYRFQDPIGNFRIKVTLRKVTSTKAIEDFKQDTQEKEEDGIVDTDSTEKDMKMKEFSSSQDDSSQERKEKGVDDPDTIIVRWQEKIFGAREVHDYEDPSMCTNALERKYHEEIKALKNRGFIPSMIFTYCDFDNFEERNEDIRSASTSADRTHEFIVQNMLRVRNRGAGQRSRVATSGKSMKDPVAIIDQSQRSSHVVDTPFQTMHIMGQLGGEHMDNEHVLCTIRVNGNGVIEMKPDFNRDRPAYRIESKRHEMFEFLLENASLPMDKMAIEREKKMIAEIYERHLDMQSNVVGTEFQEPHIAAIDVNIYGEIVSASRFHDNHLYVEYVWDTSDTFWEPHHDSQMAGITHISSKSWTVPNDTHGVSYFGFPVEFNMLHRQQDNMDAILMPHLYLQVNSLDSWGRQRIEGYGHVTVPASPGVYDFEVDTWKPLMTPQDQLRDFFIGGTGQLADIAFLRVPSEFNDVRLSKFGFRTQTTGRIRVRFNIIAQSESFISKSRAERVKKKKVRMGGAAALQNSTQAVLAAFHRARKRLSEIRGSA